ncbi:MAG: sodium:calcium antiporter [Candidatus Tectomicrobia bacterium]|uniref:Sodium:calcium antiporter n=1 Tax=Tectimicrobiota bacterium TaxID=2528274 RepID=A0A937W780_UNCTE|nr:sodium:calcium antiporter [Candidatus Tectomicrobia bacterium]
MGSTLLQFGLAAVVIVIAGIVLTRCADAIAEVTGLGRLLIGSLLLAGATSLPELMIDLHAIQLGAIDLAVGDLMGSNLCNLLILAILDMSYHSRGHMLSRSAAAHALSATMSIVLVALATIDIVLGHHLAHLTLYGVSAGSLAIALAYVGGIRLVFYDQQFVAGQPGSPAHSAVASVGHMSLTRALLGCAGATLAIILAAPWLARAADQLAALSGLGRTFVGTTLVALSTSLPEFVASMTALRMGAFDLALGNIFGSNAFNMLLLLPLDIASPTSLFAEVSPAHILTGLATILITAVAMLGQLYHVERRMRFLEPDATLMLLLILGTLGLVYAMS